MQKRMIHNDITRSAERRNTHSLFVCLFVCLSYLFICCEEQPKKKGKKRLKAYPEGGELTSFLDARVLCHHHHAKRAFGITSQIRIKKT